MKQCQKLRNSLFSFPCSMFSLFIMGVVNLIPSTPPYPQHLQIGSLAGAAHL